MAEYATTTLDSAVIMAALSVYSEYMSARNHPTFQAIADNAKAMQEQINWGTVLLVDDDEQKED